MQIFLYLAALLAFGIGIVHSYFGEKYVLIRLFRREDLPKLFGSSDFTVKTIRFAWHVTTVAWWGFAAILILMAHPPLKLQDVGTVIGCVFIIHFLIALIGSKGKHLSWIVFLLIGSFAIYATRL